jgi:DNA-directed RNA polymerase specialized sigma24 family protein
MSEHDDFHELISRIRSGDQDAAATVVREFEPYVLRFIRFAMRNRSNHDRLRAQFGASDICQSVLKSFFCGIRAGRYDLDGPDQLRRLLSAMARLHVATRARDASVILREVLHADGAIDRPDPGPGPEKAVDDKDLVEVVLKHLSPDELDILVQKVDGKTWAQIAAGLESTEDAVRKKLARATQGVRDELRQNGISST